MAKLIFVFSLCFLTLHSLAASHKTFSITDYGAVGDGKTLNTESITKAIAACKAAGGGELLVPEGKFVTGPLTFCSNLDLHLDGTLLLNNDLTNYPLTKNGRCQDGFSFDHCHDISITGHGIIDGQGQVWWEKYHKRNGEAPAASPQFPHRPYLVAIKNCQRVVIENITLQNSPMFHLVPQGCEDVTIRHITIHSPVDSPNTDGIDPAGRNFTITNCTIDTGDDCIAIKPTGNTFTPSCDNFQISNCTFLHGHGMSIGGQTSGGLRHLHVHDCTFDGTDAGIRMKAPRGAGGLVDDLIYDNLTMKNVKVAILITSYYPRIPRQPENDPAQKLSKLTPMWRHIHISNVIATDSQIDAQIIGLPEMPVDDVTLTNVNLSGQHGMQIVHAKKIHFENCHIQASQGPIVDAHDAEITGLEEK
ncbi:MAG TPA: glycoside hydrolase family 28 protein [Tepidisphaeraceae bacterium]